MPFSKVNFNVLAQQYSTPLYVYSEALMVRQFNALSRALEDFNYLICYAVKANSNLSVLKLFKELGGGFDIVSEGELRRVLLSGAQANRIVFAGVGKTAAEIEFALSSGIKFLNVESQSELKVIAEVAKKMNLTAPISLRINPDISVATHPYLATGLKTSKFGISLSELDQIWDFIKAHPVLNLVALDCHIGSQLNEIEPLENAYRSVIDSARFFEEKGAKIKTLDFGGGLAVSYSGHYKPLNLVDYSLMLKRILKDLDYEIIIEPGKFLVAEAGILLTRVVCLKSNQDNQFAVVDAGMNDLIRPSLYEAYHKINAIDKEGRLIDCESTAEEKLKINIVGPVCETGCYFAKDRELPKLYEGQLLAIMDSGAYGYTMASRYNSRLLPAEVMLDARGNSKLIRRREEYSDLWQHEL